MVQQINTIFKGEFAITNEDKYEKYYDTASVFHKAAMRQNQGCDDGEGDIDSLDSENESQLVSLSMIQGVNEDQEISASLVNEFKIKAKKMSTPMQNMIFLPNQIQNRGMSLRESRLGENSNNYKHANYESSETPNAVLTTQGNQEANNNRLAPTNSKLIENTNNQRVKMINQINVQ